MKWPWLRVVGASTWTVSFVVWLLAAGFTTDRFTVVFWVITVLIAFTLGTRPWWQAPLDWLPIIAFFLVYDWTRGNSLRFGRPVMWDWQVRMDTAIGFGTVPSAWLQEHFAAPKAHIPWWEAGVSTVYLSYFIAPFVVGGVLWVRRRDQFVRFMIRLAVVSAIAVTCYVLVPAAPPWAAARCTHAEVAADRGLPACVFDPTPEHPDQTVLPALEDPRPGYRPLVQRITARGWTLVPGMGRTRGFIQSGIDASNLVAAVPSLHSGGAMLVAAFLWPLARRRWRPLLAAYPLAMGASLVYGGDHYVIDVLLGWSLVAVVMLALGAAGRALAARRTPTDASAPAPAQAGTEADEADEASDAAAVEQPAATGGRSSG